MNEDRDERRSHDDTHLAPAGANLDQYDDPYAPPSPSATHDYDPYPTGFDHEPEPILISEEELAALRFDGSVARSTRPATPTDKALDAFFGFFGRLFSYQGRHIRRLIYASIAVYFILSRRDQILESRYGRSFASWLAAGENKWYAICVGAVIVASVAYARRRRRRALLGIHSPPWILIFAAGAFALLISVGGGLLLYSVAPDQGAKFDAVKTGITMFAGAAGVGALVLSLRNHFTNEADRVTKQFNEAVERLTRDNLVEHSAGLLALQRIARKYPAYRFAAYQIARTYSSVVSVQDDAAEDLYQHQQTDGPQSVVNTIAQEIMHETTR